MKTNNTNKTYDLTVNPDYVPSWGVWEGCREFIQNCIDGEDTDISFEENTLVLRNSGKLDISTLLIGSTSKANDTTQLGQFGEGYKLGFLALARQDIAVTVFTGNKTIWYPELKYSELYQSMILSIVERELTVPEEGITINIMLTHAQKEEVQSKCIQLQEVNETITTSKGTILYDEKFHGKLYIGGLYILDTELVYGYNFPISAFEINRDRNFVNSYEVIGAVASIYLQGFWEGLITIDYIYKGVVTGVKDFNSVADHRYGADSFVLAFYTKFRELHPDKWVYSNETQREKLINAGVAAHDLLEVNIDTRRMLESCFEYSSTVPRVVVETIEQVVEKFEKELEVHLLDNPSNVGQYSTLFDVFDKLKSMILN